MADLVCSLPFNGRFLSRPQRSYGSRLRQYSPVSLSFYKEILIWFFRKRNPPFSRRRLSPAVTALRKRGGSSPLGLPVSRRRCGGRRGGLNDSQHCAVGPGLQSPQRWSFPPASISLRRLPPLTAQQLLSLHPTISPRRRDTRIFSPRRPRPGAAERKTTGDHFVTSRDAGADTAPCTSFALFGQVAQKFFGGFFLVFKWQTKWWQLHITISSPPRGALPLLNTKSLTLRAYSTQNFYILTEKTYLPGMAHLHPPLPSGNPPCIP